MRKTFLVGVTLLAMGCAQSEDIYVAATDAASELPLVDASDDVEPSDAGADVVDGSESDVVDAGPVACVCDEPGCGSCPSVQVVAAGGYGIDATEVTNQDYAAWLATSPDPSLESGVCSWNTSFVPSAGWPASTPDSTKPVTFVDHCDAAAYCRWANKRLCGRISGGSNPYADFADATKSQWQNACSAGGTKLYPYGAQYSATACNGADQGLGAAQAVGTATSCIGGYPALVDMSGNVWEWEDSCNAGVGADDLCHIRGGSYAQGAAALVCAADSALTRNATGQQVGFRCCE